jgi:hypothetical protein
VAIAASATGRDPGALSSSTSWIVAAIAVEAAVDEALSLIYSSASRTIFVDRVFVVCCFVLCARTDALHDALPCPCMYTVLLHQSQAFIDRSV